MSSISLNASLSSLVQSTADPYRPPELTHLLSWDADIATSSQYSDSEKELFSKVCHLFEAHCRGKEALTPDLSCTYSSIEKLLKNQLKCKPIYFTDRLKSYLETLLSKSILPPRNPPPTPDKQNDSQTPLPSIEDILLIQEICNEHIDEHIDNLRVNIDCYDLAKFEVIEEKRKTIRNFKLAFDANDLGLNESQPTISGFKEAVKNLISKYEPKEKQIITEMMQSLPSFELSGGIKFTLIEKEPADPSLVTEVVVEESAKELYESEESAKELYELEEPDDNLSQLEEYNEDEKIDE